MQAHDWKSMEMNCHRHQMLKQNRNNTFLFKSADLGGEHSLQWFPCGRLLGFPKARGICTQKRPAHIYRYELALAAHQRGFHQD